MIVLRRASVALEIVPSITVKMNQHWWSALMQRETQDTKKVILQIPSYSMHENRIIPRNEISSSSKRLSKNFIKIPFNDIGILSVTIHVIWLQYSYNSVIHLLLLHTIVCPLLNGLYLLSTFWEFKSSLCDPIVPWRKHLRMTIFILLLDIPFDMRFIDIYFSTVIKD
jgi:hypothetical protein